MRRSRVVGGVVTGLAVAIVLARAASVLSVGPQPLIYRIGVGNNDLDSVDGLAIPGRLVKLWYKQRNFREGGDTSGDAFKWCAWKNQGDAVLLGSVVATPQGTWRFDHLREGNTVMMFPAAASDDSCLGGIYTQLLPQSCNLDGTACSPFAVPTMHWLNVTRIGSDSASATGSVSGADQAALAVADGPDDGPDPSDVTDVDQNGIDTTAPGFTQGQRVIWKCGAGGTTGCPAITVHDGTTVVSNDPEYPFILGTMQAHRAGGSFIAAAAIGRGTPIGFAVDVNVRLRGRFDVNLGCDRRSFFDFSVPFVS